MIRTMIDILTVKCITVIAQDPVNRGTHIIIAVWFEKKFDKIA